MAVGAQTLAAGAVLLGLGGVFENPALAVVGPTFWLVMAWCVLVMSIGALLLWFWLLRNGSATSASALHFLIPPIGLAISWAGAGRADQPVGLAGNRARGTGYMADHPPAPLRRAAVA